MTEVAFKPTSGYNSKLDQDKKINLDQGTEVNVYQFIVADHTSDTQYVGSPFIITQFIITATSTAANTTVGFQFYINNQLILNSYAIGNAASIYLPVPNWKLLKGYALKLVVDHDPANANNIYLSILGYYA